MSRVAQIDLAIDFDFVVLIAIAKSKSTRITTRITIRTTIWSQTRLATRNLFGG